MQRCHAPVVVYPAGHDQDVAAECDDRNYSIVGLGQNQQRIIGGTAAKTDGSIDCCNDKKASGSSATRCSRSVFLSLR